MKNLASKAVSSNAVKAGGVQVRAVETVRFVKFGERGWTADKVASILDQLTHDELGEDLGDLEVALHRIGGELVGPCEDPTRVHLREAWRIVHEMRETVAQLRGLVREIEDDDELVSVAAEAVGT